MSIQEQMDDLLKAAMRARDPQKLSVIRMLKSRMGETVTAKGFSGTVDDALWLQVMKAYLKQQEKALEQYEQLGVGASEPAEEIRYEISFIRPFLPTKADEATHRRWVEEALTALGGRENAKLGAVMGAINKSYKDQVDGALLRGLIEAALRG